MLDDLTKIREDALKIQVEDVIDTARATNRETTKAFHALGFAAVVFGFTIDQLVTLPLSRVVLPLTALVLATILAAINTFGRTIDYHTRVDMIFTKTYESSWDRYLDHKHVRLLARYAEAQKLLWEKSALNRTTYILLVTYVISLVFVILVP